jgi:hypothetical protein
MDEERRLIMAKREADRHAGRKELKYVRHRVLYG